MSLATVQDDPPRAYTTARQKNVQQTDPSKTFAKSPLPHSSPLIQIPTYSPHLPNLPHRSISNQLLHHTYYLRNTAVNSQLIPLRYYPSTLHLSHPSLHQNTHSNQPINHQDRTQVNQVARIPQTTAITGSAGLKSSTPLQLTTSPSLTNTQHH